MPPPRTSEIMLSTLFRSSMFSHVMCSPLSLSASRQGITLVHSSAQIEPCLTQENTLHTLHTVHTP